MSLVNRPRDGSERPIFFFDSARACQGFRSSDWFVALSDECGEGITSVWISLAHTHTDWSLSFSCAHYTHARRRHLVCGHHNPHVLCKWQHRWQSNNICEKNSIDLWKKKICVRVCVIKKCRTAKFLFHFETHTQQTAPARPLFFPAPHKFFFPLFQSTKTEIWFFYWLIFISNSQNSYLWILLLEPIFLFLCKPVERKEGGFSVCVCVGGEVCVWVCTPGPDRMALPVHICRQSRPRWRMPSAVE